MWLYEYFQEAWQTNRTLALVFLIATWVLLSAALFALIFRSESVYLALAAVVGGGAYIAATALNLPETDKGIVMAALFMAGGGIYLVLFAFLSIKRSLARRRELRRPMRKEIQYTLPSHENTYVKTRLNTALQTQGNTSLNTDTGGGDAQEKQSVSMPMPLGYARKLLAKLKEAPLTKAERLETEDVARTFAVYAEKQTRTVGDTRSINELCSWLLKLCAKYSVEI